MSQLNLPGWREDELSGVRRMPGGEVLRLEELNRRFEVNLLNMEEDPVMKYLMRRKNSARGQEIGELNFALARLREYQDTFLDGGNAFKDKQAQAVLLSTLYAEMMHQVVKNWPAIAEKGIDWQDACVRIETHMSQFAVLVGVKDQFSEFVNNWFRNYKREQEELALSKKRDALNREALALHTGLAYDDTVKQSTAGQIQATRARLAQIDDELVQLPADRHNKAAFSDLKAAKPKQAEHPRRVIVVETPSYALPKQALPKEVSPAKPSFWKRTIGKWFS